MKEGFGCLVAPPPVLQSNQNAPYILFAFCFYASHHGECLTTVTVGPRVIAVRNQTHRVGLEAGRGYGAQCGPVLL